MGAGLNGSNKSADGMVIGLVQWQLPVVTSRADVQREAAKVADLVRNAKKPAAPTSISSSSRNHIIHGLSMSTDPDMMCTLDGPEVESLTGVCKEMDVWACFSIMELNPGGTPFNSGIIVNARGEIVLHYRKLHPWCALEAWEPGDLGIPVCDVPCWLQDLAHHLP